MITRREFLKTGSLLSVAPLMPSMPAGFSLMANPAVAGERHFFVMVRIYGGMDVTLGLDPWLKPELPDAKDMFIEYRPDELIEVNPQMKLGPAAAVLKKYAGEFSIVNGVFMSQVDNGHPASISLLSKTSHSALAPVLPVEMAIASKPTDFGVLSNTSLEMGTRVTTTSVLSDLAQIKTKYDVTSILEAIFSRTGLKTPYLESVRKVVSSREAVAAFIKNLDSFGEKPEDYQVAAAAFMTDVAAFAQLDYSSFSLDTHAAHPVNHLGQQKQAWEKVDAIFSLFKKTPYGTKGENLFDRTTFMIMTEFARTPALNPAQGKDHNPMTNSVLLAGRGLRGGQVIGASKLVTAKESLTGSSYHIAYPIDFATGEVQQTRTKQAQMIFPEHIGQTLATIMKVDRALFGSIPANTLQLERLIKS